MAAVTICSDFGGHNSGTLIQQSWCPYKKRHQGRVRTWLGGDHLQAKERGLRRIQTFWPFDLVPPASRTVNKSLSAVSATQYVVLLWQPLQLIYLHAREPGKYSSPLFRPKKTERKIEEPIIESTTLSKQQTLNWDQKCMNKGFPGGQW